MKPPPHVFVRTPHCIARHRASHLPWNRRPVPARTPHRVARGTANLTYHKITALFLLALHIVYRGAAHLCTVHLVRVLQQELILGQESLPKAWYEEKKLKAVINKVF